MTEEAPKKKRDTRGRKTFSPKKDFLDKIFQLAQRGCTNEEIFKALGISKDFFYKQMRKGGAMKHALESGRERAIEEVENALFKTATGFFEEDIQTIIRDVDGKQTKEVRKTRKYYPPSSTAIIFILKNRLTAQWNDRREIEHSGTLDHTHTATEIIFRDIINAVEEASKTQGIVESEEVIFDEIKHE